jgi:hypothetical protein
MKRSWLQFVAGFVFLAFGAVCGTAMGHGGGHGGGGFGGGSFHGGGMAQAVRAPSFSPVRQASFNAPASPAKLGGPSGAGLLPVKPTGTTLPSHTIDPGKLKGGVGTSTPGGAGSKIPPNGGVLKIPPTGTGTGGKNLPPGVGKNFPPDGGVAKTPPFGPGKGGGGTGGGGTGGTGGGSGGAGGGSGGTGGGGMGGGGMGGGKGNGGKQCFPPIVLGCVPLGGFGGYYGGYYPPVYSSTVIVPTAMPVVVADSTPVSTAATDASPATTTTAAATPAAATAAESDNLPRVPVGSTITLQAKDLGSANGQVLLVLDNLTLGVQVSEWNNDYATATLPLVGINSLTKSEIVLVRADGQAASSVKVDLVPAQAQTGG